jgi:hypothetical protein
VVPGPSSSEACSEAELALIVEFLGRPPSGLLWLDARVRDPDEPRAVRVAAIVDRVLLLGDHSATSRMGGAIRSYLQVVCDILREQELPETPGDGILALEMRVVRQILDAGFDDLPPDVQAALEAHWLSGTFFADGLRDADIIHPLMTHTDADHRSLAVGQAGRALGSKALALSWKQARGYVRKFLLRVVLRRLATPVGWALTAWDVIGPAYRLTVPVICYVAYLRRGQQLRLAPRDAATATATG